MKFGYLNTVTYAQIVAHFEREFELGGLKTDGELPVSKMATITTTLTKQNQPQNGEHQQAICCCWKFQSGVFKELREPNHKEQERQGEKPIPERPNAKVYRP